MIWFWQGQEIILFSKIFPSAVGPTKLSVQCAQRGFAQRYSGKDMKLIILFHLLPRLRISRVSWYAQGEICLCIRRRVYLTSHLGGKVLKELFPIPIWCISHLKILHLPIFWHIVWWHSCNYLSAAEYCTIFLSFTLHLFHWYIESDSTWQQVSF